MDLLKLLGITKCNNCEFVSTTRTSGAGYALNYFCSKKDNQTIARYVEWASDMPEVPSWCPFRVYSDVANKAVELAGREELKAILLTDPNEEVRKFAKEI
jgi:hypothetical protein